MDIIIKNFYKSYDNLIYIKQEHNAQTKKH